MQPTDLQQLILEAAKDRDVLPRLSRAVGEELPQNRWDVLDRLPSDLRIASLGAGDFAQGFLEALAHVVRAYQTEALPRQEDEALTTLVRQRGWEPALEAMTTGPIAPTELRSRLGEGQLSGVSRLLKEMRQQGLVDLLPPSGDGRMRPHHLTQLGKRVLVALSQAPARQDSASGVPPEGEEPGLAASVPSRRLPSGTFQRLATVIPEVGEASGLES